MRKVSTCVIKQISCGSILVKSAVGVEENDDDSPANAAPANQLEFLQQISSITSDPILSKC